MESFAAERTLFAIAPNGAEHEVTLRVGVPAAAPTGEWWAAVSLGALEAREHRIAGDDAWQAVQLAMRFVVTRVGHYGADGWQFYSARGGERATPSELLGGILPLGGSAP